MLNKEIIGHKERRIVLYEMCRFVNGRLQNKKWQNRRRQEQMQFNAMLFVISGITVQNH